MSILRQVLIFVVGLCVGGCAALQSGAAAACQFIDSGNPIIGAICLTVEEAASVVQHAKKSRAAMKLEPGQQRPVDICEAP